MANVLINQGTQTAIAVDTVGTLNYQAIKLDMGTVGASNPFSGTLPMLSAGTISKLEQGSINVTAGTIKNDGRPSRNILTYGTSFGGTAAGYGTLVGSASVGAGTSTWINDVSVINTGAGTLTALVGFGTVLNGTSVLVKGDFGPQGGIQKSYPLAVNAGMTNQDLVCYVAAAGTIQVNVSYFISA